MKKVSRRSFVQITTAAAGSLLAGIDPAAAGFPAQAADAASLPNLPPLQGSLASDDAAREEMATDLGNFVRQTPRAVLRPRSAQDILALVRYANRNRLKIAMRGQGHSRSGETLVDGGIVVDSRSFNRVTMAGQSAVDAEPGAVLGDIYKAALPHGLTPPVMPECPMLSVGGVLSVGGWGRASHRFGATIDNVLELDVVTGDGRLLTCSPQKNSELFNMTLAGLGQCALIVRARMRLIPAPSHVVRQSLTYDNLAHYLDDQKRLLEGGTFDLQSGRATKQEDGAWNFTLEVWKFSRQGELPDFRELDSGLKFKSRSAPAKISYRENVRPDAVNDAAALAARARRRLGDMVLFVPASKALEFTTEVLSIVSASPYGPAGFTCALLDTRKFKRPLFRLPAEQTAASVWLFPRTVPSADRERWMEMFTESARILNIARSFGGVWYGPHSAVLLHPDNWKPYYGPEAYKRFSAAKKKLDPNAVLTPGPGIFLSPRKDSSDTRTRF